VSRLRVSCLLVEANLPDLKAESVVGAFRARRWTKWILIGTSLTVPEAVRAMRLGAYDVLQKPLELTTVEAAVFTCQATAAPSTEIRVQPNGLTLGDPGSRRTS
jgi:DNA-binding NtrC family response regulator